MIAFLMAWRVPPMRSTKTSAVKSSANGSGPMRAV